MKIKYFFPDDEITVRSLLFKANLNHKDENGSTALHVAADRGNFRNENFGIGAGFHSFVDLFFQLFFNRSL